MTTEHIRYRLGLRGGRTDWPSYCYWVGVAVTLGLLFYLGWLA